MLKYTITEYKEYVLINNIFVKNGINLIYGASGVGKSYSTIKILNDDNIKPILLDFDENLSPDEIKLNFTHLDGEQLLNGIKNKKEINIPSNEIIIIDTWQKFIDNGGNIKFIENIRSKNNTIIIIAHNKDLATKQNIPDMDRKIANHMNSKIYIEWDAGSTTKTSPRTRGVYMIIEKLRGYDGERRILLRPTS